MEPHKRKVAVLGTAPSFAKAPVHDESWEIWICAPGLAFGLIPRWDRFYELHLPREVKKDTPDHYAWLAEQQEVRTLYPCSDWNAVRLPRERIVHEFSDRFLTSTAAWMMADALIEHIDGDRITDLGLWGFHMASDTEYKHQRAGGLHFITLAEKVFGINVHIPSESELLRVSRPYPEQWDSPWAQDFRTRIPKLKEKLEETKRQKAMLQSAEDRLQGALEAMEDLEERSDGWR